MSSDPDSNTPADASEDAADTEGAAATEGAATEGLAAQGAEAQGAEAQGAEAAPDQEPAAPTADAETVAGSVAATGTETPPVEDSPDLASAMAKFGVSVEPQQLELLDEYRTRLWEINQNMNLTRHTTFDKFVSRDLIDSIELAKHLHEGETVIDVGTGGGVPGVVIAILRPDLKMSLCESVGKKAEAIETIVAEMSLPISIFAGRAEHIFEDFRFDATIARAVGPLWKMCYWFQDCWVSVGRLLATKGPNWVNERQEARERGLMTGLQLRTVASYPLVGTESESVILKIWPKGVPEK